MTWSIPSVEPFRPNPEDPYSRIRVLRIDATIVSKRFYHPEHGDDPQVIDGCCELTSPHPDSTLGGCVNVRRVGEAIGWLPPTGNIAGGEEHIANPEASLEAALPHVRRSPLWFPLKTYALFLADSGLDPEVQISRIRPLDATDSSRVLRHCYRELLDFEKRGLPSWKEIADLVLARELRPSDAPHLKLCEEAAEGRALRTTIDSVIGEKEFMDLDLVEHLDLEGLPEFHALSFRVRGERVEAWAPVGNGCWGRLAF